MLKLFLVLISISLIPIILLRVPQQDAGLSSFATKNTFLGSPSKAQNLLNVVTAIAILLYLILAIVSNL
jgi:protein translocase SecG subunit